MALLEMRTAEKYYQENIKILGEELELMEKEERLAILRTPGGE